MLRCCTVTASPCHGEPPDRWTDTRVTCKPLKLLTAGAAAGARASRLGQPSPTRRGCCSVALLRCVVVTAHLRSVDVRAQHRNTVTASTRAVALWRCGAVALWRCGAVALWRCGAVALWRRGGVALWRCGAVALWRCGGVALWRRGGVAAWRCGAVALWRCGAVALWRCGAVAAWHRLPRAPGPPIWSRCNTAAAVPFALRCCAVQASVRSRLALPVHVGDLGSIAAGASDPRWTNWTRTDRRGLAQACGYAPPGGDSGAPPPPEPVGQLSCG
jgi:hypothetical protein